MCDNIRSDFSMNLILPFCSIMFYKQNFPLPFSHSSLCNAENRSVAIKSSMKYDWKYDSINGQSLIWKVNNVCYHSMHSHHGSFEEQMQNIKSSKGK